MTLKEELESLVDKYNIDAIIDKLAEVCHDKAEHILTNWQDKKRSKEWTKLAKKLDNAAYTSNVNDDYITKVINQWTKHKGISTCTQTQPTTNSQN